MKKFIRNEAAFTLVELLFVIVIVGVLLTILVPRLNFASQKAREIGVKNHFHSFQTSAESYLRESVGTTPTESGLNTYLDNGTKFTSGSSLLKDPWGFPYKVQVKPISNAESMIIFRSSGNDLKSSSATDLTQIGDSTSGDSDDLLLVSYYQKGSVKSCTVGFSNNIGVANLVPFSGGGSYYYETPLSARQPKQALFPYEYSLDIKASNGRTFRTYLYTSTLKSFYFTNANSEFQAGASQGFFIFDDWTNMPDFGYVFYNLADTSSFPFNNNFDYVNFIKIYDTGAQFLSWQLVDNSGSGAKSIAGCL